MSITIKLIGSVLLLAAATAWLPGAVAAVGMTPAPAAAGVPLGGRGPAVPPAGASYLGGFVDPLGGGLGPAGSAVDRQTVEPEVAAISQIDAQLQRPLSIVPVYQTWSQPVYDSEMEQVLAAGAIPMVNWSCGDSDNRVAAGLDDQTTIRPFAERLASLNSPVFLRWFFDPNLTSELGVASCLGGDGPAGYVSAFNHIRTVFAAAGAANVSFVWSVDTTAGDSDWNSWYPGDTSVDWIAGDDSGPPAGTDGTFAARFQSWYMAFSSRSKPMMISGTGAAPDPAAYIKDIAGVVPAQFPGIKALVYLDAPGLSPSGTVSVGPDGSVPLGGAGLAAFVDLSRQSYFQPTRAVSSLSLKLISAGQGPGRVVKVQAVLAGERVSGSVGFLVDGRPITGCGAVPVRSGAACATSSLPAGPAILTAVYSGNAEVAGSTSAPLPMAAAGPQTSASAPMIPTPGHAYLGGWIDPAGGANALDQTTRVEAELQSLPIFNSQLGRPLSVVHLYQSWTQPAPNRQLRQILADGAMPMVDWKCGDSDANVISGTDDPLISGYARQLAALGSPVFLRWFWEPNFTSTTSAASARCLDPPGGSLGPSGYVAAFRHIHDLFVSAGATNVAFVWAVGSGGTDQDMIDYYPGSAYVDWIAVDGYNRSSAPAGPSSVAALIGRWYSWFSSFGLPMMISESGAEKGSQVSYLSQVQSELPDRYPQVKAFVYLDSVGQGPNNYVLAADGGVAAFAALSRSGYFQPPRYPSTVLLTVSPDHVQVGHPIDLVANQAGSDGGGAVSFLADGSPLQACQGLPAEPAPSCRTKALAPGFHSLTAVFSGDAEYAGSASRSATAVVEADPPRPAAAVAAPSPTPMQVWMSGLNPASTPSWSAPFAGLPTIPALAPPAPAPATPSEAMRAGDLQLSAPPAEPAVADYANSVASPLALAQKPSPGSGPGILPYLLAMVIAVEGFCLARWALVERRQRREFIPRPSFDSRRGL